MTSDPDGTVKTTYLTMHPDGVEYFTITALAGIPYDADPLEVSIDGWVTALPTAYNGDRTSATVLVAGPDATLEDPQALTLRHGRNQLDVRLRDLPEAVYRDAYAVITVRGRPRTGASA